MSTRMDEWFPIASSSDVPLRHVYQAQLLDHEYALWRADDGHINLWENRCLHRGVRLTIGINDGRELTCQYHGWRYANRTGGCTYIPAHPANSPARTIHIKTYSAVEKYGLVWSRDAQDSVAPAPVFDFLAPESCLTLRPIPVNASAAQVIQALEAYQFTPSALIPNLAVAYTACTSLMTVIEQTTHRIRLRSAQGAVQETLSLFVQPVAHNRCVIRPILDAGVGQTPALLALRHHSHRLNVLRDQLEGSLASQQQANAALLDQPFPLRGVEESANERVDARTESLSQRAVIRKKWLVAQDVVCVELAPIGDQHLATWQPGSHIDLHLPNGLVRQYSLLNAPGETDCYVIGVKLEPASRGGSQAVHTELRPGDVLAISTPRNNFPLRRDASHTVLIAGGIGITPIASMAQALQNQQLSYELHYFVRSSEHMAFAERLSQQNVALTPHMGLDIDATRSALNQLLASYEPGRQVYMCGPGPMLALMRELAAAAGWPDEAVHFEYFANDIVLDHSKAFEISLARSNMTLTVPAGKTILEVLRENGIHMPSSCEQGACGTCMVPVLEGEVLHQDVYLNGAEQASNSKIMTCVSRARGERLVLDI